MFLPCAAMQDVEFLLGLSSPSRITKLPLADKHHSSIIQHTFPEWPLRVGIYIHLFSCDGTLIWCCIEPPLASAVTYTQVSGLVPSSRSLYTWLSCAGWWGAALYVWLVHAMYITKGRRHVLYCLLTRVRIGARPRMARVRNSLRRCRPRRLLCHAVTPSSISMPTPAVSFRLQHDRCRIF